MHRDGALPQLSAAKPRVGMCRIEALIQCLVRQYELQARIRESAQRSMGVVAHSAAPPSLTPVGATPCPATPVRQQQFDWFHTLA